jgi:hypothetical protein
LQFTDELFNYVVTKVRRDKGLDLAAYQPRFIVDQVVASCKFMEQPPHMEPRFIDYALDNLRVRRPAVQQEAPPGRPLGSR